MPATAHAVTALSIGLAAIAGLTALVLTCRRSRQAHDHSLAKTLGYLLYGLLPITALALLLGALLHTLLLFGVSFAGSKPAAWPTQVTESGGSVAYRSGRRRVLRFLPVGSGWTELSIEDTVWNGHGTRFEVNGVCPIDSVPVGLAITLQGRVSRFGMLVDAIRSPEDCRHAGM